MASDVGVRVEGSGQGIKSPVTHVDAGEVRLPERDDDHMALVEGFLRLLVEEQRRLAPLGLGGPSMIGALYEAIHAYRQAESAGDTEAMAVALGQTDQLLKDQLGRVLAVVAAYPPWDQPT